MTFAFLVSLLGCAFVIRISHKMIDAKFFRRNEMTKIGTAYFASVFALAMLLSISRMQSAMALWMCVFVPMFAWIIAIEALIAHRAHKFRAQMPSILAILLLKMKSGRAFRQALSETIDECDENLRPLMSEVASVVAFSQQTSARSRDQYIAMIIDEFESIDRQPHAAARRLGSFRDKLRIEEDFRRRSGQVLARVRAQSLVMTGLYLAVLVFMIAKFGWKSNAHIICFSIASFAIGATWLWLGGRRRAWKV